MELPTKVRRSEQESVTITVKESNLFDELRQRFLNFKNCKFSGPSETNAAPEFAVNSLTVENILVIGHSFCRGIHALMSLREDLESSSFIGNWVSVGMDAKKRTKEAASNLSFDLQCKHCEKESVNCSLLDLLTYPWLVEKVRNDELSIHGGYYDFVDCTFEKWALDYKDDNVKDGNGQVSAKDRSFWC